MKGEKEPAGKTEALEAQMPPGFAQISPFYTA